MKMKINLLKVAAFAVLITTISFVTSCNSSDDENSANITVTAAFTVENTAGSGNVTFTNTTTVDPTSAVGLLTYDWDFGDGNSSTEASPSHRYDAAGDYEVKLTVDVTGSDESDVAQQTVTITQVSSDLIAPDVTLTGDATIEVMIGEEFTDPGATASDNVDGDLSTSVTAQITQGVDTPIDEINVYSTGEYKITYTVKDQAGNEGSAVRTVNITGIEGNILEGTIGSFSRVANWTMDPSSIAKVFPGWPFTARTDIAGYIAEGNNWVEFVEIDDTYGKNGVLKATSNSVEQVETDRLSITYPSWWARMAYRAAQDRDIAPEGLKWEEDTEYELSFDIWTDNAEADPIYVSFEPAGEWEFRQGGEKAVQPETTKKRVTVDIMTPDVPDAEFDANANFRRAGPSFIFHHLDPDVAVTYYIDNVAMVKKTIAVGGN